MEPAVTRGEALKIDTVPQAIVATAGICATAGVIVFLVNAGWNMEAIGAFATLAAGIIASQFVNARKTAVVEAKTDAQTEQLGAQLDQIVQQTNGMSEAEREDIAMRAADRAVNDLIAAWRRGELR
jgi:hypothetical protein